MNLENEFMSYLRIYGSTKESDLLDYGVRFSNLTIDKVKCVLEKMVSEGKVTRVVHEKLEPNAVYIIRENLWEYELERAGEMTDAAVKILNEAAELAQKRIRERFPEKGNVRNKGQGITILEMRVTKSARGKPTEISISLRLDEKAQQFRKIAKSNIEANEIEFLSLANSLKGFVVSVGDDAGNEYSTEHLSKDSLSLFLENLDKRSINACITKKIPEKEIVGKWTSTGDVSIDSLRQLLSVYNFLAFGYNPNLRNQVDSGKQTEIERGEMRN